MSYSTTGYMHCEPFVYWGDLPKDWAEYIRKVDVGELGEGVKMLVVIALGNFEQGALRHTRLVGVGYKGAVV